MELSTLRAEQTREPRGTPQTEMPLCLGEVLLGAWTGVLRDEWCSVGSRREGEGSRNTLGLSLSPSPPGSLPRGPCGPLIPSVRAEVSEEEGALGSPHPDLEGAFRTHLWPKQLLHGGQDVDGSVNPRNCWRMMAKC